ncbi:MAG: DUF1269 domain-containing protein, partial [Paracoccus sp. (in: a-proteobacteria)]|nr:DUF1269 domain-containing protein [Paracoccus sp. (in: a-proteobacteria)]
IFGRSKAVTQRKSPKIPSSGGPNLVGSAVNPTSAGGPGGTFRGTAVGLLCLNPLLGAAGVGSGGFAGCLSDCEINDNSMREIGQNVTSGGSALLLLYAIAARA